MPKGGRFERAICKRLSEWFLGGTTDDVIFWRTAGSGGRATRRTKVGRRTNAAHCGDIAAIDERGRLLTELVTFELKNGYSAVTLHALIDCPPTRVVAKPSGKRKKPRSYGDWINQAKASAAAAGTPFWAIVHHRNKRETLIVFPDDLGSYFPIQSRCLRVWTPEHGGVQACEFEEWLKICTPDELRNIRAVEKAHQACSTPSSSAPHSATTSTSRGRRRRTAPSP